MFNCSFDYWWAATSTLACRSSTSTWAGTLASTGTGTLAGAGTGTCTGWIRTGRCADILNNSVYCLLIGQY